MGTLEWTVCIVLYLGVLLTMCSRSVWLTVGSVLLSLHSASSAITNRELVELILGNISGGGTVLEKCYRLFITSTGMVPLRPVQRPGDKLKVYVSSALYQIVDLNQRNNLATISAYFDVVWLSIRGAKQ